MKSLFFLSLSIFLFSGIFSQTHEKNHGKYWYYRHRLKEHFMQVGPNQGESLVLAHRMGPWCKTCVMFGDQTITLGHYISVLATEYALLAKNNQNTDETIEEIFYALYAINRLDLHAEWFYNTSYITSVWARPSTLRRTLNGFFVRDDADKTFFINGFSDHINSKKVKTDSYIVTRHGGFDGGGFSDWDKGMVSTLNGKSGRFLNEASMDQLYEMLMGLRLIKEFIPMHTDFQGKKFQDGSVSIHREAANIALRLTSWFNHTRMNKTPSNTLGWSMTNGFSYDIVKQPQNGLAWSWAAAEATYDITKDYHGRIIRSKHSGNPAQHTPYSYGAGLTVWNGGSKNWFNPPLNARMVLTLGALVGRDNTNKLFRSGYEKQEFYHIPLLRQILHGGTNPIPDKTYFDLMNDAPCDGPRVFNNDYNRTSWGISPVTGVYSYEFSTSSRLMKPSYRIGVYSGRPLPPHQRPKPTDFDGEFNGLDFMLYHNLYYLLHPWEYSNPINLRNMDIKVPINQKTLHINVLNKLTSETAIQTNNNYYVTFNAGHEIVLKPGFSTNVNNNTYRTFEANIRRLNCGDEVKVVWDFTPRNNSQESRPFKPDSVPYDLSYLEIFNYSETENELPFRYETNYIYQDQISVFPNPSSTYVNFNVVDSNRVNKIYKVLVFDSKGIIVDSFNFNHFMQYDLNTFSNGVYNFHFCDTKSNEIIIKKVVKIS